MISLKEEGETFTERGERVFVVRLRRKHGETDPPTFHSEAGAGNAWLVVRETCHSRATLRRGWL